MVAVVVKRYATIALLCVLVAGCSTPSTELPSTQPVETLQPAATSLPTNTPEPTAVPEPAFRVVGYVTSTAIPAIIPYDKLTHINYAFLIPNVDGTFEPMPNGWKLKEIVQRAHEQDVKVLISIGGWGWDAQFEEMAANPEYRATFVRESVAFMNEFELDGIDVDWEYPDAGQSAKNFSALMHELYAETAPNGKLLTSAVVALGDDNALGVQPDVFEIVDFLNLMAYDDGSSENHSSYSYAERSINYWLERGLPPEKTVLGVPFYSRPGYVTYNKLIAANPDAANTDMLELNGATEHYNGIPTMKEKTELALRTASGIMIWVVTDDAPGDASLLTAIDAVANGDSP
jgi:chitinase